MSRANHEDTSMLEDDVIAEDDNAGLRESEIALVGNIGEPS